MTGTRDEEEFFLIADGSFSPVRDLHSNPSRVGREGLK